MQFTYSLKTLEGKNLSITELHNEYGFVEHDWKLTVITRNSLISMEFGSGQEYRGQEVTPNDLASNAILQ